MKRNEYTKMRFERQLRPVFYKLVDDAIRVVNQLRGEAHELKETNQMLLEEIKSLKVGFSLLS